MGRTERMLTQSDLTDIAEILSRRANDVAGFYDDHKGEVRILGSVEMALTREIDRLRRLEKAARATAEAENAKVQSLDPLSLETVRTAGQELFDALEGGVPDKNCSCHNHPPCHDCVDWGYAREAMEGWKKLGEEIFKDTQHTGTGSSTSPAGPQSRT